MSRDAVRNPPGFSRGEVQAHAARRLRHRLPPVFGWHRRLHDLVRLALLLGILALCVHAYAGTREATLSWSAVTLNTDGTPASITGYAIYRLQGSTFVKIATVGATTLTFTDLRPPAGLARWCVSAIGLVAGKSAESDCSAIVSKRIHLPAPGGGVVLPTPQGGVVLPPKP